MLYVQPKPTPFAKQMVSVLANKMNLPTLLTLLRIFVLSPAFIVMLLSFYRNLGIVPNNTAYNFILILAFLIILTDFLDGYLARKTKKITDIGKLLDPIADKAVLLPALFILAGRGVPLWMAFTIALREIVISILRIKLSYKKIIIPASYLGKSKTWLQAIAVLSIILNIPFSNILLWLALIVTVISGLDYVIKIK